MPNKSSLWASVLLSSHVANSLICTPSLEGSGIVKYMRLLTLIRSRIIFVVFVESGMMAAGPTPPTPSRSASRLRTKDVNSTKDRRGDFEAFRAK